MANKLSDIIKQDLANIESALIKEGNQIRTVVINTVKSKLVRRIFNDGIATDDAPIGKYETSTKKFRNSIGRRIDKVDLEVTGILRKSIQTGIYDGRTVLGIVGNKEPKINFSRNKKGKVVEKKGFRTAKVSGLSDYQTTENAINQEKHFGKDIFAPTPEEIQLGDRTFVKQLNEVIKKGFK